MKKHFLLLLAIPLLFACSSDTVLDENLNTPESEVQESIDVTKVSPVTGKVVTDSNDTHFAVMIENSPEARPQTGLSEADIVYEIKTEGNISRYLAFFHDSIPSLIGPVRSSRHYFIPLAEEMNYPYIHFGASTYAYKYLDSGLLEVPHVDGIKEAKAFSRDNTRNAPHNAYLSPNKLDDYSEFKINNEHFLFQPNNMKEGIEAKTVELQYNNFTKIQYTYDETEKSYLRFQEDAPQIDRNNNKQISVKNIIIQFAKHENINDDKYGRIDIDLIGEGTFDYYSEGKKVSGNWEKRNEASPTVYRDTFGKVLNVNPGNTWIQVVDLNSTIFVK